MITTERCILRLATIDDANSILDFYIQNKEHLAQWDPEVAEGFYIKGYWEQKIKSFGEESVNKQSLRLYIF